MNVYLTIIGILAAIIVGGSAFAIWFVVSENADRRKHYKVTVTLKPDNTLDVYKSKWIEMGREPITIPARGDMPLIDIDIRLLDGEVSISDVRPKNDGLDWI